MYTFLIFLFPSLSSPNISIRVLSLYHKTLEPLRFPTTMDLADSSLMLPTTPQSAAPQLTDGDESLNTLWEWEEGCNALPTTKVGLPHREGAS